MRSLLVALDPELLAEARTLFRRWDDDHAGILSAEDAPRFLQAVATRYEFPPELLEASLYWLHETYGLFGLAWVHFGVVQAMGRVACCAAGGGGPDWERM